MKIDPPPPPPPLPAEWDSLPYVQPYVRGTDLPAFIEQRLVNDRYIDGTHVTWHALVFDVFVSRGHVGDH